MKYTFILVLFFCQTAIGQVMNSIYPKLPYTSLSMVAVEGDYIYTSGNCDVNMISVDGGDTWQIAENSEAIRAIRILPGSNGSKALMLSREELNVLDGNSLDQNLISNGSLTLGIGNYNLLEVDASNIYVIGNSTIYKSDTDNISWTSLASLSLESNDFITASDISDNYLWLGTKDGAILKVALSDGMVTNLPDFDNRIYAIEMVNDQTGYVSAQQELNFSRTTDGWQSKSACVGMPENISPVAYGENLIISVNTNRMYVSNDGGLTGTYTQYPQDGQIDLIYNTYMTEDGELYFVGSSATVLKTPDFTQSFENLNPYPRSNLRAICINANGSGYAVGENGSVVKTTDGGDNWMPIDLGFSDDVFLETMLCYEDGRLLIGHNDGLSIFMNDVLVNTVAIETNELLQANDGDYLMATQTQNGGKVIARSADGGLNWEVKANVPAYAYGSLSQSASGKFYAGSGDVNIYVGTNQGNDWDIEQFDRTQINRFAFLNDSVGVYSGQNKVYKTTDGGQSSEEISGGYAVSNLYFFNEDHIMFTTAQNQQTPVKFSDNGGDSFSTIADFCARTYNTYFDGSSEVWFAQRGGHINKIMIDITQNAVKEIPSELNSLYPNPNVSKGVLKLDGLESGITSLNCFNMLGDQVFRRFISQQKSSVQLPEMPAGNYMLLLENNGKLKQGKLVIVD